MMTIPKISIFGQTIDFKNEVIDLTNYVPSKSMVIYLPGLYKLNLIDRDQIVQVIVKVVTAFWYNNKYFLTIMNSYGDLPCTLVWNKENWQCVEDIGNPLESWRMDYDLANFVDEYCHVIDR